MKNLIVTTFLAILSVSFINCHDCSNCRDEAYTQEGYTAKDTTTFDELHLILDSTYIWLNEPDIKKSEFDTYRMNFVSFFNKYLIRIEKKGERCFVTIKKYPDFKSAGPHVLRDSIVKELPLSEWNYIDSQFYRYHFWTAKWYNYHVAADGYAVVWEGRRPQANFCGKKTDQMVIRISPGRDDEMGLLDSVIEEYFYKDLKRD